MSLLEIKKLNICVKGRPLLVSGDFNITEGEIVGLFGGSGSGKSVFSLFLMGFLGSKGVFSFNSVSSFYRSRGVCFDLFSKNSSSWCGFRSSEVSMIFQDPATSLNPTLKCGAQIKEAFLKKKSINFSKKSCIKILIEVGIDFPEKIINSYPHEISGGQKQRVVIAIALASSPRLLIADEPTTSLDPVGQRSFLDLLLKIKKTRNISVVLISHNLDLLRFYCDRFYIYTDASFYVSSSRLGRAYVNKKELLLKKLKSRIYLNNTKLNSVVNGLKKKYSFKPFLLKIKDVSVVFYKKNVKFYALKSISFSLKDSDVLGVVGGSGSGKTTLGRVLCGIENNFSGYYNHRDSFFLKKEVQMVYQDPYSSFNPKIKSGESVQEIINLFNTNISVHELFKLVNLNYDYIKKYPHELSGGEKQRLSIARVLASFPKVIVFDESLSGLDLEVQISILNLIRFINIKLKISVVFISHDMRSVSYLCKKIIVLKNGNVVDFFNSKYLDSKKRNYYTKDLISASKF